MRPYIEFDEMLEKRDLLELVLNSFEHVYNILAKERGGIIYPENFDALVLEIISTIENKTDKLISEGFLEFIIGLMFMNDNSADMFKQVRDMFGWTKPKDMN